MLSNSPDSELEALLAILYFIGKRFDKAVEHFEIAC